MVAQPALKPSAKARARTRLGLADALREREI